MTLRNLLTLSLKNALTLLLVGTAAWTAEAREKIDIEVAYQKSKQYQVQSQYQHSGTVIVDHAGGDKEPQKLPIDVTARLKYQERFVGSASKPQAIRIYNQSKAKIKIDKGTTISQLSEKNKMIVARLQSKSGQLQAASVFDVLSQSELELLKNPADPLSVSALINKRNVKTDQEWKPTNEALANFLAVDRVIQSNVKLLLRSVENNVAKIYVMGKVSADVDDVITDIEVNAIVLVDLQEKIVSSVRLNTVENRQPGQVAPGFDGKNKIDLQISVGKDIAELSNEALAKIAKSYKIRQELKWQSEEGKFELIYDPNWKMIASEEEAAILRYIENGDLLAQCNIVRMGSRPASKPLLLTEFRTEIEKIVKADESAKIVDASQSQTPEGNRALQVTVYGEEDGVPLNWIYYNVSSPDGRQVTVVFTLEEEIAGRVRPAAAKMINGFVFLALPKKAASTPATRDAKARSQNVKSR